ncbi:MAG: pyruvate:ferredoxin (flavodoxin) oxidoreductase [Verrucomicrobia bacterium]|nr:pyruvate:ferredoxin (flavodoxin) oxidoreductase [Verrucomicrobiota bacterium]MCH8527985.1 pyruvate:ferredoxin (flavodoxin) oxidoreductase [Kiritimatiellia bacterium]
MPRPSITSPTVCIDGNHAAADVAYRLSELCAIYPITPSSRMGELADEWSHQQKPNLWGAIPEVVEMQSEGGAAGALHGALQTGALATTFTSSQGLLLMLPNFYKIAGELTPCVVHVAARAIATQGLSIFGDHSDVMAARPTGFAMLFAASVQEAHDFALISQAASLQSRIPFLHVFDGFRTSHELAPVQRLADDTLRALIDPEALRAHRERSLNPNRPVLRGTAQNPDVFFQSREASNRFYDALPGIVQAKMDRLAAETGREYHLVDYTGAPDAERVIVIMGSGAVTAAETSAHLNGKREKVGVLTVRLYRPWPAEAFLAALPNSVTSVAVLDRTKEPGAPAEPLCLDVAATLQSARPGVRVTGGRYGLGSKEFTPAMVRAVFDELALDAPRPRFTVGIEDDLTHLSLPVDPAFHLEDPETTRAVFYGLGSDGTVGANRNTLRILSEHTPLHTQGYFVFDSNKAGSRTVSHLRFGPRPVRAPYLIQSASFIACHHFSFVKTLDLLETAVPGATLLLNAPHGPDTLLSFLPTEMVADIQRLNLRVHVIDAARVAREAGLGGRINTVMQTCFFALTDILPREEALEAVRQEIRNAYGAKGADTVAKNLAAINTCLDHLHPVPLPRVLPPSAPRENPVPADAPDFVRNVTGPLLAGKGDKLPVSALPVDGTWPTGTAKWNKRDLSPIVPAWEPDLCIQCGHCVLVCPHGVITVKQAEAAKVPDAVPASPLRGVDPGENLRYLLNISLPDCTGCGLCVEICPAKDRTNPSRKALNLVEKTDHSEVQRLFDAIPVRHDQTNPATVRGVQYLPGTFEFPGACAGCGETPYLRLVSQLFGDRMLVANATGCSSIYGGNLPTTPWTTDNHGRGPAWSNSLFEDNAEFGYGFRLGVNALTRQAQTALRTLSPALELPDDARLLLDVLPETPTEFTRARQALARVLTGAQALPDSSVKAALLELADHLIPRSVWIIGGDGWAYDIGFGGLDHVLSAGENVNVLVLDTEVYSNTGGQASKATPLGAAAKFAVGGKATGKTDLALQTILKGNVYVANIALGAKLPQALRAIREAEAYPGPSLLLAYSPCIAHGYSLTRALTQEALAVDTGHWPLFRYDPRLKAAGKPALLLDSPEPNRPLKDFLQNELRFRLPELADPALADARAREAQTAARNRYALLKTLSET